MSVPYELRGNKAKAAFVRDFCERELAPHGLVFRARLHRPGEGSDIRAFHAHIIVGDRARLSESQLSGASPVPPKDLLLFRKEWLGKVRGRLRDDLRERGLTVKELPIPQRKLGPRYSKNSRQFEQVETMRARRVAYNRAPLPGLSLASASMLASIVAVRPDRLRNLWDGRNDTLADLHADLARLHIDMSALVDGLDSGERFAVMLANLFGGEVAAEKLAAQIREEKAAVVDHDQSKVRADRRELDASRPQVSASPSSAILRRFVRKKSVQPQKQKISKDDFDFVL